jgi:sporulation protein YlmC with PRC-barrel domain
MSKISLLLSMFVLVAMVLAACGGGPTSTNVAESPPPVTIDVTEDMSGTATDSPTEAATEPGTTTETPGVPVTGEVNPARLSNQLDFTVWSQDGEQIGEVDDMVLDLDNTQVAYVVVGTGGFLDLGERDILVPWNSLQLQTGTGETTGGQQNAFILQTDVEVFSNAPDFDLDANLPQAGQPAADWDVDIRTYWESGGATGGTANTPAAGETPAVDMTATANTPDAGQATATGDAGQGTGLATETLAADQGTGENLAGGQDLQGVVLASEVLDSTITLSPGEGQGQGQGQATADPNATVDPNATADPNATVDPNATAATEDAGQGVGNIEGTVDDMIVAVDTGEIQYIVVDVTLDEGQRWIPVPLSAIQWDVANGAFLINANPATFRDAPFFENGQYPDTTVSGWNSEFDTFWQSNGSN